MQTTKKKVVVIGGGFAGVNFVKQLAKNESFEITLVDLNNYNFFPPLLYQVATGFLEPSSISYPFRKFLRHRDNVRFRMAALQQVVAAENKVILSNGELHYDILVMATGAATNYFGMENVKKHAIPMKTLSDALAMRNLLLNRLEEATRVADVEEKKKLLTIVVAGAGPTGVEVSGMFAEMRQSIIRKDYPELGKGFSDIILVDGGDAVLGPMSVESQHYSKTSLEKLGVKVLLQTRVKDFDGETVTLTDHETITIKTRNLIWAAGVSAIAFEGIPAESLGPGKRMTVDAFNKLIGSENIYAIGDTCFQTTDAQFPKGHPQVAQVAIQQGKLLAKNLSRNEADRKAFVYNDKGSMAIIGRNKAVADIPKPKFHFNGFLAWAVWLFIHVMSLLTVKNRLRTFGNWVIAYFSKDQSFRMIIQPQDKDKAPSP
ncbi:NAD(P)/FAD-dependent oxidoreductase [Niabella insulamsoli]|uniref:NAD(P)/FAD-dependent oxidoreductase n=1 Tax=Niabella insulamsoli TaxID=3144874 RepID=UPI0031FDBAEA